MFLPPGWAAAVFSGAVPGTYPGVGLVSGAVEAPSRVQLRASINGNLKSLHRLWCRLIEYLSLPLAKHIFTMV